MLGVIPAKAGIQGSGDERGERNAVEAHALVEFDFSERCVVKSAHVVFDAFFKCLVAHVHDRNQNAILVIQEDTSRGLHTQLALPSPLRSRV